MIQFKQDIPRHAIRITIRCDTSTTKLETDKKKNTQKLVSNILNMSQQLTDLLTGTILLSVMHC